MPTIRQLAALAGVSHSTVSRALRGDPRISAATSERIRQLAEQYHFHPNRLAQTVFSGRSTTLGCIMTDVSLPFESRMLRGVMDAANAEAYRVIVLEAQHQLPYVCRAICVLLEQRVAGILLCSGHPEPLPRATHLEMRSHGVIPVALDFSAVTGDMDRVCTDEAALGEAAIRYLLQLGHRHIAYVGPPVGAFRGERAYYIRTALRRYGLSTAYLTDWRCTHQSELDANAVVHDLLTQAHPPTAIIGWEDRVAVRLMHAAQRRGLAIPRDVSVLGCANLSLGEFTTPALTSIEQDPEEIGRQGCMLLLTRLNGEKSTPQTVGIPSHIVPRHSCASPNAARLAGSITFNT